MKKPLISLCMIVKNEEDNLPACLESVRGLVDEIVLVDTGSRDATAAIAEAFGARVFSVEWRNDFAAARNKSLDYAFGDWVFYLDADERLDANGRPDCIRNTVRNAVVDAWSVPIKNHKYGAAAVDITSNIRLFRNLPEVRFENEVHERVEPALARINAKIGVAPFFIDHLGYMLRPEAMEEKLKRNLALSQKHLERDPQDPYCLYYMGATLLLLQKTTEGREYFHRALKAEDLPLFLKAMTYNFLAYLELQEDRLDEAIAFARESSALVPRQNTCYLLSGLACFRKSKFDAALAFLAFSYKFFLLPPEMRETDLSQEHSFIEEAEFHKLLGICLSETGKPGDALGHFRQFFESGGDDPEIARRAGLCAVNTGDFVSGLEYLEEAERLGVERSDIALPMALACIKQGDFGRARIFLEEVATRSGDAGKLERIRGLLESEMRLAARPFPGDSPRISLCMIVRDEEERLPGCLESVKGSVDEIVVVDTGSTDNTKRVARSYGARVFTFPWVDDFAAARNESLRHAEGEWILFLDADERLNPLGARDCLRKAASGIGRDAFEVPIANLRSNGQAEPTLGRAIRFFRNLPGIRFSGRVHESVDLFLMKAGIRAEPADFRIDHFGYGLDPEKVKNKYRRNLELLLRELADNPGNANASYHLGLTHMALENEAEARKAFDHALRGNGLTPALEAMALNMKSYHHLRGGELQPALDAASRSLEIIPLQNTGRLLKGLILYHMKQFGAAIPFLLEGYRFISLPPEQRGSDIYFEDSIDKVDLVEMIGNCFSESGQFAEAIPFLKFAALVKAGPAVFERLGISLLRAGDYAGALDYLQKAQAGIGESDALALPLSFACLKTGDFERASDLYRRAAPKDAREVSVAFQLIQAMAAERRFEKYLPDCIRSKLDLLRNAFPEDMEKFMTARQASATGGLFPPTTFS